ncbi:YopX family protein [Empedobacter falsenii]|uniref:YopX family protein n=1 Tax=Empedobacter falsenii TaxID=343874 RepID=UPI003A7F9146
MIRDIEFKGERIDNGKLVFGSLIVYNITKDQKEKQYAIKLQDSYNTDLPTYKVTAESIGQFTGLSDKNENKIFEGKDSLKLTIIGLGEGFVDVIMKDGQWFIYSESQGFAPLYEMLNNPAILLEVNNEVISAKNFVEEAKLILKIKDMDRTSAANYLHGLNMEEWEIKELLDRL